MAHPLPPLTLVTTPTGRIGSHLVRALRQDLPQLRLRLFDREGTLAPAPGVQLAVGDLRSEESLARALDGVDTLFLCIPQSSQVPDVDSYYDVIGQNAARALRRAGVSRVVFVSSGGRGRAPQAGFVSALHRVEDLLAAAAPASRFLRCGSHLETLLEQAPAIRAAGVISSPLARDLKIPRVAVADIAAVARRWLLDPGWSGAEGVAIHGAADLDSDEVARTLSLALGRAITYREVPTETFVQGLVARGHVSPAYAAALADMFRAIGEGLYSAEPRTEASTTPTSLASWAREVLRPAVEGGTA